MIVECAECEAKVDAKLLAEYEYLFDESNPYKVLFLVCPSCKTAILASSSLIQTGRETWDWSDLTRLWPKPLEYFDDIMLPPVRKSLVYAKKCYNAKIYPACAVMCGRALEAICIDKTGEKKLGKGLKKLKDQNIIDSRLYEWGEVLRKERNIGAHATEEVTTEEDARDVLDFAIAICEYIFVLSEKYKRFVERKEQKRHAGPQS